MMRALKLASTVRLWAPGVLALAALATPAQAACPMTVLSGTVVENFDDAADAEEGTTLLGWGTGTAPFGLELPQYRDLTDGVVDRMEDRLITVVAGNFDRDLDGYDDLIALVQEINPPKLNGVFGPDQCELRFYRNLGMTGNTHNGFDTGVELFDVLGNTLAPPHCDEEGASLHVGDVDGDGTQDLVFYTSDNIHTAGTPTRTGTFRIWAARNCPNGGASAGTGNCGALALAPGDLPVFSTFQGSVGPNTPDELMAWHWGADPVQVVSWNDDTPDLNGINIHDRWDLVWTRSSGNDNKVILYHACQRLNAAGCENSNDFNGGYGFGFNWRSTGSTVSPNRIVLLSDAGFKPPFASSANHASLSAACGSATYSLGITVTLPADFDNDGDIDLILGSMSEHDLRYFENTGSNAAPTFTPGTETIIPFDKGGPAYGVAVDYDLDGYPDLAIATDRYSCGGGDGKLWIIPNNGAGSFVAEPFAVADLGDDVDWLINLDANGDGYQDLMVGRNVLQSPYYLTLAKPTGVYRPRGVAISKEVPLGSALNPATDTLTQVKVSALPTGGASGTITLWVSNNDGQTWEEITEDEMPPTSEPHLFTSFGTKLRWKLQVEREDALTGADSRYAPGATQTPEVQGLTLEWTAVTGQFRHSASGLAYGKVKNGATERELLFVASTLYPDLAGTLEAYEITDCASFPSGSVQAETCVSEPWPTDAGEQLATRAGSSRVVYTAHQGASTGRIDTRLTLTTPLSATLKSVLGTTDDNDWRFVRDGMTLSASNQPKMREVGHSTPAFVGAPGDPKSLVCLDPDRTLGFASFATAQANRKPMVYLGANSGAVHAFDAINGDEEWAFVPHNLASKLRAQRGDGNAYKPGFFVDGPLVVRDVYDADAGAWRTILIGGQARGAGRNDENYYFALDVTDPADPKPLWEFSDPWADRTGSCDGNPCDWVCTRSCPTVTCSTDCTMVSSFLTSDADPGDNYLRISSADFPNFPATGIIELQRPKVSEVEVFRYTKSGTNVLNLVDELGGSATVVNYHAFATRVVTAPNYIFQESGGRIVMQAEKYHQARTTDGTHNWHTQTLDTGFTGVGYIAPMNPAGNDSLVLCDETAIGTCGAQARYTIRFEKAGVWDLYAYVSYPDGEDDSFHWGLNNAFVQRNRHVSVFGAWHWVYGHSGFVDSSPTVARVNVTRPGLNTFNVWMRESDAHLDRFVMVPQGSPAPSGNPAETCEQLCTPQECSESCTLTCVGNPDNEDWPECGTGMKCCDVPGNANEHFCAPTSSSCDQPDTVMGETWSPPAVGRFLIGGQPRWLVVFGSGYDNRGHFNAGRSIYAVDAITGEQVGQWDVTDLAQSASNPSTIDNTVPGGVTLLDMDVCQGATPGAGCGYVDRIYFGDLEGRLWKIDTSDNASLDANGLVQHTNWPLCVVFDAGDEDGNGSRTWAPIITKPAAAVLAPDTVNIYFGTGGDDRAPGTETYRFYSVRDDSPRGSDACSGSPTKTLTDLGVADGEWIIGDGRLNDGNPVNTGTLFASASPPRPLDYEGSAGDRYWTDPIIVNNVVVVFASVTGKLDSMDPCETLDGTSDIYVYAIRNFRDANGTTYRAGDRYLAVEGLGKIRQAAVVRGQADGVGFNVYGNCGVSQNTPLTKAAGQQVFIPTTADPTNSEGGGKTQVLSDPIGAYSPQNSFKVLRWREIPM